MSDSRRCPGCGELVEGKWPFCTYCGSQLSSEGKGPQAPTEAPTENKTEPAETTAALLPAAPTSRTPPPPTLSLPYSEEPAATNRQQSEELISQEWYSAPDLSDETTATRPAPTIPRQDLVPKASAPTAEVAAPLQANNQKSAPALSMLSAYGEPEAPAEFQWWHGALLGLLLLLLAGGIGFGGWYWWSHRASVAQATPPADSNTSSPPESTSPSRAAPSTSSPAPGQTSRSGDEEFQRLRERRISAKPSESGEIVAAFSAAEKKYSTDYRYPYERAKLSIKGITSHHEAFSALAAAGEKAIDNGKAQEMLESLNADKDGDFYKVSRGHHEWQALVEALSNKDKRKLSELHH